MQLYIQSPQPSVLLKGGLYPINAGEKVVSEVADYDDLDNSDFDDFDEDDFDDDFDDDFEEEHESEYEVDNEEFPADEFDVADGKKNKDAEAEDIEEEVEDVEEEVEEEEKDEKA